MLQQHMIKTLDMARNISTINKIIKSFNNSGNIGSNYMIGAGVCFSMASLSEQILVSRH